ncbi:cytochrome P450 27C1 [Aspergillus udagawae]|uniref:Cytochrome P450 27C1 n=1 Tax=Aspergillus udagawae TaxID=91492 RepID=A0A8H3XR29_9EURO|nr:cytochrome P450 27C1 [Aspergillus udagawae]
MVPQLLVRTLALLFTGWSSGISCVLALYLFYQWLLPKPIVGIPFSVAATQNLLGDVPDLAAEVSRTRNFNSWLKKKAESFNSPVAQVFMRPFSKPFVILSDFREIQDILLHRKDDFDRTDMAYEMFGGLVPNFHLHMKTNARWKSHRRLLQDLMVPRFLNNVAAPAIYSSTLRLIDLWKAKCSIADGRPFSAADDIHFAALDAVLAFSFGSSFPHSATGPQLELISTQAEAMKENSGKVSSTEEPVNFSQAKVHEAIRAMVDLTDAMARTKSSIFPLLHWKVLTKLPPLAYAVRVKNDFIMGEVKKAVNTLLTRPKTDDSRVRSAVDHIVDRENRFAEKEARAPSFLTDAMRDEVFGFVVAGHDTTSTTVSWGVKFLADHSDAQSSLRTALCSGYSDAVKERRQPTLDEITHTQIPYLDACIEEILRCAPTVPAIDRQATRDTTLLGHRIPKGTAVFFLTTSRSFFSPPFQIDKEQRSPTFRDAEMKDNGYELDTFEPRRWLIRTEEDQVGENIVFDSTAAPTLPFGGGVRGCFGRRLAYLELRLLLVLIIWNFELQHCPKGLSGYRGYDGVVHKPVHCFVRLAEARL